MEFKSFHCPDCGGPVAGGAIRCEHCGSLLVAKEDSLRPDSPGISHQPFTFFPSEPMAVSRPPVGNCPVCKVPLVPEVSCGFFLDACPRCGGLWMDHPNLDRLCIFQAQELPSSEAHVTHAHTLVQAVAYHPCPACRTMMNRSAFARISGITLDICKDHGTWFQPGQMDILLAYLRTPDGIAAWNDHRMRSAEASAHHEQQNVIREIWETPQIQQLGDTDQGGNGLGHALKDLYVDLISETGDRASGLTQPLKDFFGRKGKP